MVKRNSSYNKQRLLALLAGVSGHFEITSPADELSIRTLQEILSSVILGEDISAIKNSFFSVENSDLFSIDTIDPHQLMHLQSFAGQVVKEASGPDLRVFVREVPVRSTQIKGSVPLWAGGAAVEKTIGPFLNKDGRKIWFDFFRIEEFITLYIDGQPNPAILFKVTSNTMDPLREYRLAPGSLWVNSGIFSPNAHEGFYTGLKIKQGEIILSDPPQIINGKLTISPETNVTVKLDLDPFVFG